MRVRVDVAADVPVVPWEEVHGPARGTLYGLLSEVEPELARSLHDGGWGGHPLRPVGMTSPLFRGAPVRAGVFTTSQDGSLWFGSPVPEIASALVRGLAARSEIRWGSARLSIRGVELEQADQVGEEREDGLVELSSVTPVVVKREGRYLLPGDEHYVERLRHNLAHKADVLGLPAPRGVWVVDAGPRRRFTVRGAPRIGARVRVALEADRRFVAAVRCWGLGLDTVQGFGWVR
ncbi:CRISPR-associated endoribonuclease Cas6 [Streptomyces sp. NBRC 109706]|uniref:CRISPR-associated endoribonuclease Cas6 n=1 Tax=Streptomyces sp. NBRC 109706 TaxID=1550035 RepID=UPI0007856D69|nr:CRISPR-associated endoribonuclease Cas6 [Streptomyces sp. NBRC 109706]